MDRIDQVTLARGDEIAHFALDVVQDPKGGEPDEDKVGGVAGLGITGDIAECELVETSLSVDPGRVDGEKDDPGDEPATS